MARFVKESYGPDRQTRNGRDPQNVQSQWDKLYNCPGTC
jgi:hypothetical protein